MQQPRIERRAEIAANRFFTYAVETLDVPSGPYDYHQIECRYDAVLVVPVLPDGRLVIERVYRHPYRTWLLEFPAGGIEPGEDALAAGARELAEETGYACASVEALTSFEAMPGMMRMRMHVVLANGLRPGAQLRRETLELMDVIEMTENEAWAAARAQPASSFLSIGLMAYACRGRLA